MTFQKGIVMNAVGSKGGKDKEVNSRKFQDSEIIRYHTIMVDAIMYVSEHTECITPNVVGSMNFRKHHI